MPPNEVDVKLIFTCRRSTKLMGKLAEASNVVAAPEEINDEDKPSTAKGVAGPREGNAAWWKPGV